MKNWLIFLLAGVFFISNVSGAAYKFDFSIDKNYEILSYGLKFNERYDFYENSVPRGEENVQLRLFAGEEIVYERELPLHFFIFDVAEEQDVTFVQVYLPYSEEDSTLELRRNDRLLLELDMPGVLCNENNICDGFENFYSCESDCAVNAEDDVCITFDDGLCDLDCDYDSDCGLEEGEEDINESQSNLLIWIVLGTLLVVGLIVFLIFRKKN